MNKRIDRAAQARKIAEKGAGAGSDQTFIDEEHVSTRPSAYLSVWSTR
jgi:hypothetical protein